jgi:multidrug efflux pump subunit AcrA (membrane-fusion protein)
MVMRPGPALVAIGVCLAAAAGLADEPIRISSALLKLVEQVDVPAEQAGVLREVLVTEGMIVQPGQKLVQIDDQQARLTEQRASIDVQMAERLARDRLPVEIASKTAEQSRQKLGELRLQEEMAARQAANQFKVEAAGKAQAVAENELARAEKARERFTDSVSQSEIDGRRLEAEKAALDAQQSQFELDIDALKHDVASEALRGQELAVGAADLEVAQAEAEHEVAQLQASLKKQDLDLARLDMSRRSLTSPLDGVVVEIYRQRGEWVQPGDPVIRVLRLNRLWVEGFIRVEQLSKCVEQSPVRLTVTLNPEETVEVQGRIVFVGREVDPVNREVLIRAEIPNDDFRLLPGMEGELELLGTSVDPAAATTLNTAPASR